MCEYSIFYLLYNRITTYSHNLLRHIINALFSLPFRTLPLPTPAPEADAAVADPQHEAEDEQTRGEDHGKGLVPREEGEDEARGHLPQHFRLLLRTGVELVVLRAREDVDLGLILQSVSLPLDHLLELVLGRVLRPLDLDALDLAELFAGRCGARYRAEVVVPRK